VVSVDLEDLGMDEAFDVAKQVSVGAALDLANEALFLGARETSSFASANWERNGPSLQCQADTESVTGAGQA
jgi:hypothetical protein